MLALIGTARYETLIRRLLSTKGSEAAPLLSPEIQPVLVVQRDAPELDFLKATHRFWGTGFEAASVGDASHVWLHNPAGSGILAVLEFFEMAPGPGVQVIAGPITDPTIGVAGATLELPADSRLGGAPGACELRTLAQVASNLVGVYSYTLTATEGKTRLTNAGLVMAPGSGIGVRGLANVAMSANFIWTERALEQSEEE